MAQPSSAQRAARLSRRSSVVGRTLAVALLTVVMLAASASPAGAQLGALKKLKVLKDAVSGPDSAARVKDSLAKIAVANGTVVAADTAKVGQSLLSRATSAAGKASEKFEKATGVSAKDAALVATGAGVANVAAKKLGMDPMSLAASAMDRKGGAAANKVGAPGSASSQAAQGMAAAYGGAGAMGSADAQLMLLFQQEMTPLALAANSGDPVARAKVEAWQKLVSNASAEAVKLSSAGAAGDPTAYAKMQQLQMNAIREWIGQYGSVAAKASLKQ